MLAAEREDVAEAISFMDRALLAHPGFAEARRHRAILLARHGEFARAMQDINGCLEREPRSGATLYAAACVTARAAERTLDPSVTTQSLDLLEKAFQRGYGRDRASTDPDLASLRKHPAFRQLVNGGHGTP
jgi:hypothetical protein